MEENGHAPHINTILSKTRTCKCLCRCFGYQMSLTLTAKSCIKSGSCAIFELFDAASFQVRLLFNGGLYANSWVCKTRKNGLANEK